MDACTKTYHALTEHTRTPVRTIEEVSKVRQHVHLLQSHSAGRWKSAWDLAKIVSSVLRCALSTAAPSRHLLPLFVLGFHVCPIPACHAIGTAMAGGDDKTLADVQCEVVRELLQQQDVSTASVVILSLLNLWHRFLVVMTAEWSFFKSSSTLLARYLIDLIPRTAEEDQEPISAQAHTSLPHDEGGTRGFFSACWMQNIMGYGVRYTKHAADVSSLLMSALVDPDACSATLDCIRSGITAASVVESWRALRQVLFLQVIGEARGAHLTFQKQWDAEAAPILCQTLLREPPPLVEEMYAPFCFVNVEEDLEKLQSEAIVPRLAEKVFDPLLLACRTGSALAHFSGVSTLGLCSQEEYERYLCPTIAIALRHRHLLVALEILQWTASFVEADRLWAERLSHYLARDTMLCNLPLLEPGNSEPRGPPPLFGVAVNVAESCLDTAAALDVLVMSSDIAWLRVVCDGVGRGCAGFGQAVLKDCYASSFILEGLQRLVHQLLDAGDVPLARAYLVVWGRYLVCCPVQGGLASVLEAMGRIASAITRGPVVAEMWDAWWGTSSLKQWKRIAGALSSVGAPSTSISHDRAHLSTGSAFATRRAVFQSLRGSSKQLGTSEVFVSEDTQFTVVELSLVSSTNGSATLEVVRWRYSGVMEKSPCIRCVLPVGEGIMHVAKSVLDVCRLNRAQLIRGSGRPSTVTAVTRQGDAAAGNEGENEPMEPPCLESEKERWWAERFQLDRRMQKAVRELEDALGAWRLALLGDVAASVQIQLEEVSQRLVRELCHLLTQEMTDSTVGEMVRRCAVLLSGLPYLSTGRTLSESEEDISCGIARYKFPSTRYHPSHDEDILLDGCLSCRQLRQELGHALRKALQRMWIYDDVTSAVSPDGCTHRLTRLEDVEDALLPRCQDWAREVLGVLYHAAKNGTAEGQYAEHVDLIGLPRRHIYLVVDAQLQCLPWEGMDILWGCSTSRVPALNFVMEAFSNGGANSQSFHRTHLYLGANATKEGKKFDQLIETNEEWSVDRGSVSLPSSNEEPLPRKESVLLYKLFTTSRSLYVYAAHRRGEDLVSRAQLYERFPLIECRNHREGFPGVLLMGCSSARMFGSACCESYGMPFAYLHAGAPWLIGCLWDITDRDVDKLTCRFLATGNASNGRYTVGEVLARARPMCRLPYLSAASTVMFGINRVVV